MSLMNEIKRFITDMFNEYNSILYNYFNVRVSFSGVPFLNYPFPTLEEYLYEFEQDCEFDSLNLVLDELTLEDYEEIDDMMEKYKEILKTTYHTIKLKRENFEKKYCSGLE